MKLNKILIFLPIIISNFATADFVLTVQNECTDCEFVLAPVVEDNTTLNYEELTEQDVLDLQTALRPWELDPEDDEYCNWNDEDSDCFEDFDWVKSSYDRTTKITIDSQTDIVPALRKLQLVDTIYFKSDIAVPEYFKHWNIKNLSFKNSSGQFDNLNTTFLENIRFDNANPSFDSEFDYSNVNYIQVRNTTDSNFPELTNFINAQELDIYNNSITTLPFDLANLSNLREVYASNTSFNEVPLVFGYWDKVTHLTMNNTQITHIDDTFINMDSLTYLNIESASIKSFSSGFCYYWSGNNLYNGDGSDFDYIKSFCNA